MTTTQRAKPSCVHQFARWGLLIWTVIMVLWAVSGMSSVSEIDTGGSAASEAGVAIGTGIGMTMICGIWFVGFVVLGIIALITRPSTVVVVQQSSD